jgi:hypothetical protein
LPSRGKTDKSWARAGKHSHALDIGYKAVSEVSKLDRVDTANIPSRFRFPGLLPRMKLPLIMAADAVFNFFGVLISNSRGSKYIGIPQVAVSRAACSAVGNNIYNREDAWSRWEEGREEKTRKKDEEENEEEKEEYRPIEEMTVNTRQTSRLRRVPCPTIQIRASYTDKQTTLVWIPTPRQTTADVMLYNNQSGFSSILATHSPAQVKMTPFRSPTRCPFVIRRAAAAVCCPA